MFGISIREGFNVHKNTTLIFGGEIKRFTGKARTAIPLIDTTVTETAAFAIVNQRFFDNVELNGGFRLNNHSVYGSELIPQINLSYDLTNTTNIYSSVAKGFRSPTLSELFIFGANTNLKPERLWSYEAGVKQKFFSGKILMNITGYLVEGKDFIVMTGMFPNNKNQNLRSITNRGFEFETRYFINDQLSLTANYSYLKMNTKIIGSPEQQAFAEVYYQVERFLFNINIKSVTNLYTNTSLGRKQSYVLLSSAVWYKIYNSITAFTKIDNILNREYEMIDGYPMPGRSFVIGLTFDGLL